MYICGMSTTEERRKEPQIRKSKIKMARLSFLFAFAKQKETFTLQELLDAMVKVPGKCPGKCPANMNPENLRPATTTLVSNLVKEKYLAREGGPGKVTTYSPGEKLCDAVARSAGRKRA